MLEYNEEKHEYTLDGKVVPSVTQLAKEFSGMSTEWLEKHPEYAERGTIVHNQLAEFYKNGTAPSDPKAVAISCLVEVGKGQQVEVLVYNKTLGYAGTLDMAIMDGKKCRAIIDFKSGEHGNKRYYRCQLSLYLLALTDMGVDTTETKMHIVTPESITEYEPLTWEEMNELKKDDLSSKFESEDDKDLLEIDQMETELDVLSSYVERYNRVSQRLKEKLSALFESKKANRWVGNRYSFAYVHPTKRVSFDSAKAKQLLGEHARECEKETIVAGSVRMTEIKGKTNE